MDSQAVVGAAKSLEAAEMILTELKSTNVWRLTEESQQYVAVGASAELQLFRAIPEDGIDMAELMSIAGPYAEVGFRQAMQQKLIRLDKSGGAPKVLRAGPEPADASLDLVKRIDRGEETDTKTLESGERAVGGRALAWQGSVCGEACGTLRDLHGLSSSLRAAKKRKLAVCVTLTSFRLTKGPKFALERQALAAELTQDMIVKGTWRETAFKEVNWAALGLPTAGGHLHPLLKVWAAPLHPIARCGAAPVPPTHAAAPLTLSLFLSGRSALSSARSSSRWASRRCPRITTWSPLSGTSMSSSSPSSTPRGTPTTPSSSPTPPPPREGRPTPSLRRSGPPPAWTAMLRCQPCSRPVELHRCPGTPLISAGSRRRRTWSACGRRTRRGATDRWATTTTGRSPSRRRTS